MSGCCGGTDVSIRPASQGDRGDVERLLAGAGLPLDGLADQFGPQYAVAEWAGGIVAAAGIEVYGSAGLLRSVVVDATWRGTGLGRALVEDRLSWTRERGLTEVYLLTTTAADFFARLGFERVERDAVPAAVRASSEFASVCPVTAAVMVSRIRGER